jgi:hypothetical protein
MKGLASGPGMNKSTHRLVPDRGPATRSDVVNGGKLGEMGSDELEDTGEGIPEDSEYLSELVEDVLLSKGNMPGKDDLMDRLDKALKDGSLPSSEYREIERRLNNIDK